MSTPRVGWGFEQGDEIAPGRYALAPQGGGNTFEVWSAWDEKLFTVVAAKLVRPDQVGERRARRRINKEADALSALAHPAIPRCFDVVADGERPHLALEYIEGPTLELLLEHGLVGLEQLLPTAMRLCSALHYIAAEGWVHLDVKPSNIVAGAHPRLIDFSVAKTIERARLATKPTGTDLYMAPEQCEASAYAHITPAADIWGLGAVLFESVTGSRPFKRARGYKKDDPDARWPQRLTEAPEVIADVPRPLLDVIGACLAHEASRRPVAAEVAAELEKMTLDRLNQSPPPSSH